MLSFRLSLIHIYPLFSVDLSDPYNPKIIGTLKIPGFSEYLHPYGDGLLLGIGEEVDEKGVESNQEMCIRDRSKYLGNGAAALCT